ncbi:MAG: hypothetical protein N2167_09675 [Flavobacteriales bacterium]|nr:hypothetical protein [Flavobacteriales bacterium]
MKTVLLVIFSIFTLFQLYAQPKAYSNTMEIFEKNKITGEFERTIVLNSFTEFIFKDDYIVCTIDGETAIYHIVDKNKELNNVYTLFSNTGNYYVLAVGPDFMDFFYVNQGNGEITDIFHFIIYYVKE